MLEACLRHDEYPGPVVAPIFVALGPGSELRSGRDDNYPCRDAHMARSRSAVQMRGVSMPCASS